MLEQLENFKREAEKMVSEYEVKVREEKQKVEQAVSKHQAFMKRKDEDIQDLLSQIKEKDGVIYNCKRDVVHYIARFANLVWVANEVIERIPELLKMADAATHPLTTPPEILNFIEHCKELVWSMRRMAKP